MYARDAALTTPIKRADRYVKTKEHVKTKSKTRQYVESIAIALVLALFVRSFMVEAFTIPSGSMEPTLLVGDYLIASRLSYVVKVPFTDTVLLSSR